MQKKLISFIGLLTNLVEQAPKPALEYGDNTDKSQKAGTTIRISEETRNFFDIQAENLGVSVQECISMTLHAVMRASCEPQATQLEHQVDRFLELFESHQIPMTDIPVVLANNSDISRVDLLSRNNILNKLDTNLLEHLSKLFYVNVGWLKGLATTTNWNNFVLYKNPVGIATYLASLKHENRNVRVFFIVNEPAVFDALKRASTKEDNIDPIDMGVVVEIEKFINGVSFKSYNVFENGLRWNYGKCRRDLKAVMMFCDKTRIPYDGMIITKQKYTQLFQSEILATTALKRPLQIWHPDQLLWDDERNTERNELPTIARHYKEEKLDVFEVAVKDPWRISDWKKFIEGEDIKNVLKNS